MIIKFLGKVVIIVEIWMGSWGGYGVILWIGIYGGSIVGLFFVVSYYCISLLDIRLDIR